MPSKQTMPLGTILQNKGWVSEETLNKALKMQGQMEAKNQPIPLGKLLVRAGKITPEQLEKALSIQKTAKSDVLRSRNEIEEMHGQLVVQHASGTSRQPFVSEGYDKHILVAENAGGDPLILVTPDFFNEYKNVFMSVRQKVLSAYAGSSSGRQAPKVLKVTPDLLDVYNTNRDEGQSSGEQTDAEDEFEALVKKAYESGAVDLHFFRKSDVCTVRFRIHGQMRTWSEWNPEKADTVIGVGFGSFNVGSKYAGWDKKEKQRVRIKIRYSQHIRLDCRYEHAPGDDGAYHACIRILANDSREISKQISLEALGFTRAQHEKLEAAISEASGLVLLSGPTGSGKSTTMAGMVKFINRNNDVNVLTVESPIERELPAFQTAVSDDEDAPKDEFANAIKSMLRRDPDVGMVGEIRDAMSATATATGVQTGHIMLSTVHAQSAIEIVDRLSSPALALPPQTIGSPSFLNALVFQQLIPVLDEETKIRLTRANIDDYMSARQKKRFLSLFPQFDQEKIYVRGSSAKNPEGIGGMSICAEVVIPDDYMRSCFRNLELTDALNHWRRLGASERNKPLQERVTGLTAADHAIEKVRAGMVDPRDLEDHFGHMNVLAEKRDSAVRLTQTEAA